jgi:hypothetical protein
MPEAWRADTIKRVGSGSGVAITARTVWGKNTLQVRATNPPREWPTKTEGFWTTSWRNA